MKYRKQRYIDLTARSWTPSCYEVDDYPISKIRKEGSPWVFIEIVHGTFLEALMKASKLQRNDRRGWHYRIWDQR